MLGRRGNRRRVTLGADKAYDVADFVDRVRERVVRPDIAVDGRRSKFGKRLAIRINQRSTRHPGYAASQRLRKRIEDGFGWIKTTGRLGKTRHRGLDGWAGCSHSLSPTTTWFDCPSCSPRRRYDAANRAVHAQPATSVTPTSVRNANKLRKPTKPTNSATTGGIFGGQLGQPLQEDVA